MKIFLLLPRDDRPWTSTIHDPWKNSGALCNGVVIRAETYAQAREMAAGNAGAENAADTFNPWLQEDWTSCTEITQEGPAEVIMSDDLGEEEYR